MTTFQVKTKRLEGSSIERVVAAYSDHYEAAKHAAGINNKPFCPFYAWVDVIVGV